LNFDLTFQVLLEIDLPKQLKSLVIYQPKNQLHPKLNIPSDHSVSEEMKKLDATLLLEDPEPTNYYPEV